MFKFIRQLLQHPLTRDLDLDDPKTTELRRQIIYGKPFLRQIYAEWYQLLLDQVPSGEGIVLELGSGGGFLKHLRPGVVTSDVIEIDSLDIVFSAEHFPLRNNTVKAVLMTNVFHHVKNPRLFLSEVSRCVRTGGCVAMVEPWNTAWSRLIYAKFHHERFDPDVHDWKVEGSTPLSDANGALPWIVFHRDREILEREFAQWKIERIVYLLPFRYLLSGGVSMRAFVPSWATPLLRYAEKCFLIHCPEKTAMFALIVLRRT